MPVGQAVIAISDVFAGTAARPSRLLRVPRLSAAARGRGIEHAFDEPDHLGGCRGVAQRLRRSPGAPAPGPGWTAASCARRRRPPARRSGTPGRPGRRWRRSRPAARNRANAIDASRTAVDRQCGIAMPPGRPVADCASRASAACTSAVAVIGAAGVGDQGGEPRDHRLLVGARVDVEQDQVGTDDRCVSRGCLGGLYHGALRRVSVGTGRPP